jgi:hypothetical protein
MNEACSTHGPKESQLERTKEMHPLRKTYAQKGGHGLDSSGLGYEQTAGSCEHGMTLHIPQNARFLDKLCN